MVLRSLGSVRWNGGIVSGMLEGALVVMETLYLFRAFGNEPGL